MDLVLIAAMTDDRVIADSDGIPWDEPEDQRHFRETTEGHPVIMGRTTWDEIHDSLGGGLPDRTNIVLTSRPDSLENDAYPAADVDDAISQAEEHNGTAYVIGGASVYEQFLDRADRMVLTEIHDSYEGDTYFPEWEIDTWDETERVHYDSFDIVTYERKD